MGVSFSASFFIVARLGHRFGMVWMDWEGYGLRICWSEHSKGVCSGYLCMLPLDCSEEDISADKLTAKCCSQ